MKYIGHLDKHSPGVAEMCEETSLSIQMGRRRRSAALIGPIYLFAMRASRARGTEPAGQREKVTDLPREKPPRGA